MSVVEKVRLTWTNIRVVSSIFTEVAASNQQGWFSFDFHLHHHNYTYTQMKQGILVLGVLLSSLSPLFLVLLQLHPGMSPFWYYAAGALSGLINWIAVALSSLSDVMPPQWRAPSFGLLLAGFSLGFAVAPQFALLMGHWKVSILALVNVWIGLLIVVLSFPETLPPATAARARLVREEMMRGMSKRKRIVWNIGRPLYELTILNRSELFRLLSLLAFFSGMVTAGDRTLSIYYLEERVRKECRRVFFVWTSSRRQRLFEPHAPLLFLIRSYFTATQLAFNDKDIALMFSILGVLGIFVQACVLKLLNDAVGERRVVMLCFALGTVHNLMYGFAKDKMIIFIAAALSAFVGMSFPTISALKSNNVVRIE
jgi:MFS transporter, DHA1 family, tetracycline resistance protein